MSKCPGECMCLLVLVILRFILCQLLELCGSAAALCAAGFAMDGSREAGAGPRRTVGVLRKALSERIKMKQTNN